LAPMKDGSLIRKIAENLKIPVTEAILQSFKNLSRREGRNFTLFAACPNSETVLKAALLAAKRANAPIKFAATLNQVDLGGGYTKWNQRDFVQHALESAQEVEYEGPVIIALDHGGPYLKDIHRIENWPFERAMAAVKESLSACLLAGYDLLHIDATVDPAFEGRASVPMEIVVDRTVELIEHVEHVRADRQAPPISYEVGTEEVGGGITEPEDFKSFLELLKEQLLRHKLPDVWPCFIVGRVGTDLHTTAFSPNIAMKLAEIASTYGSVIKGHYTDYVVNLEAYPASGVGGANVGPEFSDAEYSGLMNLVKMEEILASEGKVTTLSNLDQILKNAVVASRRWEKWRRGYELGRSFDELSSERQSWLVRTGCRYIWTEDKVVEARRKLYQNLMRNGVEAEKLVIEKIVEVMMKYFRAFNLIDSLPKIESELLSRQMQQ